MKKKSSMVMIGLLVLSACQMQVAAANAVRQVEKVESKTYEEKYAIEENTIICNYRGYMYYPSLKSNGKLLPWTPIEKNADTYLQWKEEKDQNLDLAWEGFTFDYVSHSDLSLLLAKSEEKYEFMYTNDMMEITLQVVKDTGKRYLTVAAEDGEDEITILGDGETVSLTKKENDSYTCNTTYNHYQFLIEDATYQLSIPAKLNDPANHGSPSKKVLEPKQERQTEPETTPTVGTEEAP